MSSMQRESRGASPANTEPGSFRAAGSSVSPPGFPISGPVLDIKPNTRPASAVPKFPKTCFMQKAGT
ncbi:hypothetical protein GQ53DRAFT_746342 [Thozetella sp. PMI_491]|nr:hypothetical protein GQ53DRAFT_746342 [Thozetella sp. PMI_491]